MSRLQMFMKCLGEMFVSFGLVGDTTEQKAWQLKNVKNDFVASVDVGCTIQIEHLAQFDGTNGCPDVMSDTRDVGEQVWPCLQPFRNVGMWVVGSLYSVGVIFDFETDMWRRRWSGHGRWCR